MYRKIVTCHNFEVVDEFQSNRIHNGIVSTSTLLGSWGSASRLVGRLVPSFGNGSKIGPGVVGEELLECWEVGDVAVEVTSNESWHGWMCSNFGGDCLKKEICASGGFFVCGGTRPSVYIDNEDLLIVSDVGY